MGNASPNSVLFNRLLAYSDEESSTQVSKILCHGNWPVKAPVERQRLPVRPRHRPEGWSLVLPSMNIAMAKTEGTVVTGLGCVTALGNNVQQSWDGLVAGRS